MRSIIFLILGSVSCGSPEREESIPCETGEILTVSKLGECKENLCKVQLSDGSFVSMELPIEGGSVCKTPTWTFSIDN